MQHRVKNIPLAIQSDCDCLLFCIYALASIPCSILISKATNLLQSFENLSKSYISCRSQKVRFRNIIGVSKRKNLWLSSWKTNNKIQIVRNFLYLKRKWEGRVKAKAQAKFTRNHSVELKKKLIYPMRYRISITVDWELWANEWVGEFVCVRKREKEKSAWTNRTKRNE